MNVVQLVRLLEHEQPAKFAVDIAERGPGGVQIRRTPIHEDAIAVGRGALAGKNRSQPDVIEVADITFQIVAKERHHRAIEENPSERRRIAGEIGPERQSDELVQDAGSHSSPIGSEANTLKFRRFNDHSWPQLPGGLERGGRLIERIEAVDAGDETVQHSEDRGNLDGRCVR